MLNEHHVQLTSIWRALSCIFLYLHRAQVQAAVFGGKMRCSLPDRQGEGHDPTHFGSIRPYLLSGIL